jgi:hypothetical protein
VELSEPVDEVVLPRPVLGIRGTHAHLQRHLDPVVAAALRSLKGGLAHERLQDSGRKTVLPLGTAATMPTGG